jgi:hypothetical protein
MIRFAEVFPDEEIVAALRQQLRWIYFKQLFLIVDALPHIGPKPCLRLNWKGSFTRRSFSLTNAWRMMNAASIHLRKQRNESFPPGY